jgi:hypothetical protein
MKLEATNRYIVHINPQAAGYKNTEVEPLYQTIVDRFHSSRESSLASRRR